MATQLFFRNTVPDWSRGEGDNNLQGAVTNWEQRALSTSRGAASAFSSGGTITGPVTGIEVGTTKREWISDPFAQDITISGSIVFNLWGAENNMSANVGLGCIIQRLDSQGAVVSTIADNPEIGIEVAVTTPAVRNESSTPTSTNMLKGDRLRVRVYLNDAAGATMATGFNADFYFDGPTAAVSGDSYITFTENFGFLTPLYIVAQEIAVGGTVSIGGSSATEKQAQSFQVPSSMAIGGVNLLLAKTGSPTDNTIIEIQTDASGAPSGSVLATASASNASLSAAQAWVPFSLPASLTGSTTYWIVARRSGSVSLSNNIGWVQAGSDTYAAGARSTYNGSSWSGDALDRTFQVTGSILYLTDTAAEVDPNGYATNEAWTSRGSGVRSALTYSIVGPTAPLQAAGDALVPVFLNFSEIGDIVGRTKLAMSFPAVSSTIKSVGLYLTKIGSPADNLIIEVQTESSGAPSGTALASTTYPGTSVATSGAWHVIDLTDFIVTPGTSYWIVVSRSGSIDAANYCRWGSSGINNLPGANGIWNGSAWNVSNLNDRMISVNGGYGEWFTKQLTAFTLDGLVACNIRASESVATANVAVRCEIAVCASDGTSPVVWGASNDGVELGTTEAAMVFTVAGDATSVIDGQRLRFRVYFDDAPGVASAVGAATLYFAGTSAAASGDTYITLPQTVTEYAPTGDQSKSASDAATGADASSLTAAQAVTEAATGSELAVLTVPITASDTVVGADASALVAVLVATDTGSAADAVSTLAKAVTDAAVGADTWVNTAQVRTDTATGVDASLVTVPMVATDTGSGADVSVLTAAYPVTETASGADASILTALLAVTDLAAGADAASVSVGAEDKVGSDSATASDISLLTAALTRTETATATESIPTFAKVTTDSANAGDIAALDAGAFKTVFDSGSTTDTVLAFALTATDTATGVDAALLAVPGTATISNTLPSVIQAITGSTVAPVLDSFNRADGAIGVSDSGHTWLAQSGTWSISSNRAYRSTSEGQATVVIDSGLTSVALSADAIFAANPDSGVIFGGIDDDNYLLFSFSGSGTSLILWKRDASTFTLLSSYTVASYASTTQAIRVEWFANTGVIGLWFGGPQIGTVTLSAGDRTKYAVGTRQGLREHTTAGDRTFFDNYSASLPTEWTTATASNSLPVLSTQVNVRHANTTDWSNEASDTTESGAGTQVIVVTVGV